MNVDIFKTTPDWATKKVWQGLGFTVPEAEMPLGINRQGQEVFHINQVKQHAHHLQLQEVQ